MNQPQSPQKTPSGSSSGKTFRADDLCNHETKQKKAKVARNDESEEKLRATVGVVSLRPHEASSESQKKSAATATDILANTNTTGNIKTTGTDEDLSHPEIVQMQVALELIPDKEAYREAQRRVPFLVATESPPLRFLRHEDFDPSAAAKRLVHYWKKRKDLFGKRAFLPLDLTGNGALGAEDIIVVNTKCIALLPPDQDNRACFYNNRLPMKDGSLHSNESRNRAIFYWFQVLSESKAAQTDGVACLNVVPVNHFAESNQGNVRATFDLIKNAIPVRVHSAHMIFQPPVGRKRTFTETIIPSTMQVVVGTFFWRAMKFHVADTKQEMCQKLQEHRFTKSGIPVSLGGSWEYDQVEDWKMARSPIEKKHHEEFLAQGSRLSLDQEREETSTFQETESVKENALAELEDALELISDGNKAALMEARQRMPATVNKEADPIRFLRLENYNTWAAARRLVTYWSTRKQLFDDRAFLPMNQTGEGTLNSFDIAALCTGYIALLPNDKCGRSVCYCDTSKIASQSAETRMRVAFYMLSIACENDMTQKDGMVFVGQPKLDKTSRKIGQIVHDALPSHMHLLHIVNGGEMRSKKTNTEILVPRLLNKVADHFGQQTVVHVADSGAELGKKLEGYDFAIKHLPKGLGGTWNYDKFAQWQDQRMRYEWEIPAGTGHKDSGYVLEYTVTPLSELTEEEQSERKRRMSVLHSRRKRERRKVEAEVFQNQVAELEQSNDAWRADSRHLEKLLEEANAMVVRIEGLRHSAEMAHASSAVYTMPSASSNVADLRRARQSLAQQQQLIQQALTQQHLEGKSSSMTLSRIQILESLGFNWGCYSITDWEDRLSELADYRKIHGHCNVPANYSENTQLGNWVGTQRTQYRLHLEGKTSQMTPFRIQELESFGFEWKVYVATWEDRLSELVDYRKIHGHCNIPTSYSENTRLASWVSNQRKQYNLHLKGKTSSMTLSRVQELESLGFEWRMCIAAWEVRFCELADYRKIQGHCNVPHDYSENTKLSTWVATQRNQYRLHLEGKKSSITLSRIQELESLGFKWGSYSTAWEERLCELASYRKIHGHCNVPQNYSENTKLSWWVSTQRRQYRLHLEGKKSFITLSRIQELEWLDFEWKACVGRKKGTPNKPSLNEDATALVAPEHTQQHGLKNTSAVKKSEAIESTSLSNPKSPSGMAKSASTSSRVEPKNIKRVEARDASFDETVLDGSLSESSATRSLHGARQAAKSLCLVKSAPADGSMESNTRKDALQAKLHWEESITSFSHALLAKAPSENDFLVSTKRPANSRQGANSQLETALPNEIIRITGYH